MHIFVINLARSEDRRTRILARLAELGLEAEIFDAVDGSTLPLNDERYNGRCRRLMFGKDLTSGERGCAYSHLGVYAAILNRGLPFALVLEDDALLKDDLPAVLSAVANVSQHWDIVRFIQHPKTENRSRPLFTLNKEWRVARPLGATGGAYGYLINDHACQTMIRHAKHLWVPVDILLGQVWFTGLRHWIVTPSPIAPDYRVASTIGGTRFERHNFCTKWEAFFYPLTRMSYKIFDAVIKRVSFYGHYFADKQLGRKITSAAAQQ